MKQGSSNLHLVIYFCLKQVVQRGYELLLVSQFTLIGHMKGNKPDFHLAMPPNEVLVLRCWCCQAAALKVSFTA